MGVVLCRSQLVTHVFSRTIGATDQDIMFRDEVVGLKLRQPQFTVELINSTAVSFALLFLINPHLFQDSTREPSSWIVVREMPSCPVKRSQSWHRRVSSSGPPALSGTSEYEFSEFLRLREEFLDLVLGAGPNGSV